MVYGKITESLNLKLKPNKIAQSDGAKVPTIIFYVLKTQSLFPVK